MHDLFDDDPIAAQAQYRDFLMGTGSDENLWSCLTNGLYLGTSAWAKQMRAFVESRPRSTDHPKTQRAIGRPHMQTVIAAVAKTTGESVSAIVARGSRLRHLVAWLGWHEGLITLRSIAASLKLRSEGHISRLIRRCESEFGSDEKLLAHLDHALATLRA